MTHKEDLKLTSDRDIEIDKTGDFASVSDRANINQQFANAIFRAYEMADISSVNPDAKEEFKVTLRDVFRDFPYTDERSQISIKITSNNTMEVTIISTAVEEPYSQEVTV